MALGQGYHGQGDSAKRQSEGWLGRLWGRGASPASKTPAAAEKKASGLSLPEWDASRRVREEEALHRRNQVILKLREIGLRIGDDALLKKVDQLQEQAWELYLQKTACPPGCCDHGTKPHGATQPLTKGTGEDWR